MKYFFLFTYFITALAWSQSETGEVVVDPTIRLRCEALQIKKNKKLDNKEGLIRALEKNKKLLKETPYNRTSIIEKLTKNQENLIELINARNVQIKDLNDFIVRRGCPADNFDMLTEAKLREMIARGAKSGQTLLGYQKKRTDYSASSIGYDELNVDADLENELAEVRKMEKDLDDDEKESFFTKNNHISFSLFRYSQTYIETVEGLDQLDNSRTASLGGGLTYVRDDNVFGSSVRYYFNISFANEGQLEVSDDNGASQTFEEHTNFVLVGGIHLSLWRSFGLFGYVSKDDMTTLYAENPSAVNPSEVLGVRNYSLIWVGGGIDHQTVLLTRRFSFAGHVSKLLNHTSDVEIDTETEELSATRFGFDVGVNLYKKLWGEFKMNFDTYSGSSELSTARTTFGLRYDLF